jgi:hypothetical protein
MQRVSLSHAPAAWLRLVLAALLACAAGAHVVAQSATASVGGLVTDDTGGALPGVTITVANKGNGVTQTLVTGADGRYRAVALQPAAYDITAELAGFGAVRRTLTCLSAPTRLWISRWASPACRRTSPSRPRARSSR